MAVVNVLYDTGSRDESRELTGVAHLFEHLMFGGSVNVADFDGEMERAGGVNNAWTSKDYTNFYDVVPVQNIEVALRLESDRMLGLSMSEESLRAQLAARGCEDRLQLSFHKALVNGELPYSIGGGIGQSRLCMFLLQKAHIGEVQASIWPEEQYELCKQKGILLM